MPNILRPVLVIGTIGLALAIIAESTLSFLGVGVPPTTPSLGTLIRLGNDFLFSGDPSVEDKILNGELKSILRDNIERLNKQQLLVLQLYYVEELNVYEIAEVLSVSTGRVSQIKSAAVKALRELIESQVNA